MKKAITIVSILLAMALVSTGVLGITLNKTSNELNDTTRKLTETEAVLDGTKASLTDMTALQKSTEEALEETKATLSVTQDELISTKTTLAEMTDLQENTAAQLADTKTRLAATETELAGTRVSLADMTTLQENTAAKLLDAEMKLSAAEADLKKQDAGNNSGNVGKKSAEEINAEYAVGKFVTFGHYPVTESGMDNTPIEWLVLDVQGDKALLLSRYGLDAKPYNTEWKDITWEKCTLRTWLNGEFLNKAFSAGEQKAILTTNVENGKSQGYGKWSTSGGNDTQDKVFLLSYAEANKYLGVTYDDSKNTKSLVAPTAYAVKNGAWAAGWWWLRSPGDALYYAADVSPDGSLSNGSVNSGDDVVRPAFWIDLKSEIF